MPTCRAPQGVGVPEGAARATADVLPAATDVSLAAETTLDLCGVTQTVHTVSGTGTVCNSAATRAVLTLTGDTTMTWSLEGDIALNVAAGATLDLNGRTVTVAEVGGAGRIVNGTLVVTDAIQPGGAGAVGTLTFATAPVVEGATLFVEGDGAGGCDKLVVEGAFDLSTLALHVVSFRSIRELSSVLVEATTRTGTFRSNNIRNPNTWLIAYTPTQARLRHVCGTVLIVR